MLQKGRGGGLSGAFGGGGGHSAFGAKTGDVFTWITVALTFFFILIAVIGNWIYIPPSPIPPPAAVTPIGGGKPTGSQPA
jgi:preprotein translocase subunit SecG